MQFYSDRISYNATEVLLYFSGVGDIIFEEFSGSAVFCDMVQTAETPPSTEFLFLE